MLPRLSSPCTIDQITSPFYWQAKASKLAQRDLSVEEFSDLNRLASSSDPKDKVRLLQRVAEMERMSIPKMLARIEVAGYLSRPAGRVKDMVSSFGNMVFSQKVGWKTSWMAALMALSDIITQ